MACLTMEITIYVLRYKKEGNVKSKLKNMGFFYLKWAVVEVGLITTALDTHVRSKYLIQKKPL